MGVLPRSSSHSSLVSPPYCATMRALSFIILLAALILPAGCASVSPPSDTSAAADLQTLQKQAARGNAAVQFYLGVLYANGNGGPQDYVKARQWYEKAAAQGNADAQYALGYLSADVHGVPQDDIRAYMWLNLAAAHSTGLAQKSAIDSRDKVARRMTPAQIAESQRLSQQCQAQGFKGC